MIADTHVHTHFSGDCEAPVETQLDQAVRLGMKEICITDHYDYDVISEVDFTFDIPKYFSYMKEIQQKYADRIRVNIGVELGLQLHIKDELIQLAGQYPFDFVIGSNHFVDGLDVYFPVYFRGKEERERYEHYFDVSYRRLKDLDCYDSAGHLDYVVRYGPNTNKHFSFAAYQDYIDPILKVLIEKGKGLECNTGGFKYGLGHPNPHEDILKRYRELGGEIITIGSDSHDPRHLGFDFEKARQLLLDCGFRYYAVYRERQAVMVPL